MAAFRIAVIGGDGIGPEVIEQAVRVVDRAVARHDKAEIAWNRLPWSSGHYKQHGRIMPADGFDDPARERRALEMFAMHRPDGITLLGSMLPQRVTRVMARASPVVFINGRKAFKYHMDEQEFLRKLSA